MIRKGNLLISEPFLPDQNFVRSVILLAEHNTNGSLGFVLNQQSNLILEELGKEFENLDNLVYIGGPVEKDTLHFIHNVGDKINNAEKITDLFYWGGDLQQMLKLLHLGIVKTNQVRFFLGYSGWSAGQLNQEIEKNTWITIVGNQNQLFDIDADKLWREVLKNTGGKLKEIANYPLDPRLN